MVFDVLKQIFVISLKLLVKSVFDFIGINFKINFFLQYLYEKSRGVCETLWYAPGGNKVKKAIFSFKVKVKVTRSLTLVPFEKAPLVEYACQI